MFKTLSIVDAFKLGRGEQKEWEFKQATDTTSGGWVYASPQGQYVSGQSGYVPTAFDTTGLIAWVAGEGYTQFITNWAKENAIHSSGVRYPHDISIGEETFIVQIPRYEGELTKDHSSPRGGKIASNSWRSYLNFYGQTFDYAAASAEPCVRYEKLLGAIRKDLSSGSVNSSQYGGATISERVGNEYISTGSYIKVNNTTDYKSTVFGGDTYLTMFDHQKTAMFDSAIDGGITYYQNNATQVANYGIDHSLPTRTYSYVFPVETTVNTTLRTGFHMANKENFTLTINETRFSEFLYENIYSAENDLQSYFIKDNLKPEPEVFDYRIAYSSTKEDNELVDSWRNFKTLDFKDLEGTRGGLIKLSTLGENIVFVQENGIGIAQIKPLSTTIDQSGSSIVLGKGETIANIKYLSRNEGLQNSKSFVNTGKSVYWLDTKSKNIYTIGQSGVINLSETLQVQSLLNKLLENLGNKQPAVGYNKLTNEVLFSINNKTLVFNETTKTFISVFTTGSSLYMPTEEQLFSVPVVTVQREFPIYIHESEDYKWYGSKFKSSIEFIVNKTPSSPKVFDSLEWYAVGGGAGEDLIDYVNFSDSTNGPIFTDLTDNTNENYFPYKKVKEKIARLPVPRTNANYRFRDIYLRVKLTTNNSAKLILHYVKTLFRISRR